MKRIGIVIGLLLVLTACGGGTDPGKVVEQYLQAKITGDKETMRGLLCSDMEANLDEEAASFASVSGADITGMTCARDGDKNEVRCTGTIVAIYGTEKTEFPLTSYNVVQEDGEWKWCGEASG